MWTYPKSTKRVRRMPMHLSLGHVTLMPGKFSPPSLPFFPNFPQSDLRRRADSRWALLQSSSSFLFFHFFIFVFLLLLYFSFSFFLIFCFKIAMHSKLSSGVWACSPGNRDSFVHFFYLRNCAVLNENNFLSLWGSISRTKLCKLFHIDYYCRTKLCNVQKNKNAWDTA